MIAGVDDAALYVAPTTFAPASAEGAIRRTLKTDGSATTIVADDCGAVAYGVHDANVYWARGPKLMRAPKTGGPPEVVLDLGAANNVLSIAFDACNVYVNVNAETLNPRFHLTLAPYSIWGQGLPQASRASAFGASAPACDEAGASADASTAESTDASAGDAEEQ
jgi:hypothetical protein